jgi:hypothetical protein
MYKIAIPITNMTTRIVLPKDKNVIIFAATLSDEVKAVTPASMFYEL